MGATAYGSSAHAIDAGVARHHYDDGARLVRTISADTSHRTTANIDAVRQVIERGFGRGDLSVADEFAGSTIAEHEYGAPSITPGAELLRAMITAARAQMPGLTLTVEDIVAHGDKVWARSTARASNPRSEAQLSITVLDVCRFENGRIVEHWGVPDRFALLDQLGVWERQSDRARTTSLGVPHDGYGGRAPFNRDWMLGTLGATHTAASVIGQQPRAK